MFTDADHNWYIVLEKDYDLIAGFDTLAAALAYIDQHDTMIYDFTLLAIGRNGDPPTIEGRPAFYAIDRQIEPMRSMLLNELDGSPYFMTGQPFHYDKNHVSAFDKCWGWLICNDRADADAMLEVCERN